MFRLTWVRAVCVASLVAVSSCSAEDAVDTPEAPEAEPPSAVPPIEEVPSDIFEDSLARVPLPRRDMLDNARTTSSRTPTADTQTVSGDRSRCGSTAP